MSFLSRAHILLFNVFAWKMMACRRLIRAINFIFWFRFFFAPYWKEFISPASLDVLDKAL